jgi:hypothetical protein
MARKIVDQELIDVSNDLKVWSEKRGTTNDGYISGLLKAIDDKQKIGYWANLDPFVMLPKPTSARARKLLRVSRLISIFRNVLIFTPVALTWYAIGEATTAFQVYISSGGSSTANFLEFWQNGYGILDEKWRIGNVAFLDFLLIVVIIFLSFITGSIQIRALSVDYQESEIIESERFNIALQISRALHDYAVPTTPQINAQIISSIRALSRSTQDLNKATSELKKSAALGEKIKKSGASIESSSRKTEQASAAIVKQVQVLQKLTAKQSKKK